MSEPGVFGLQQVYHCGNTDSKKLVLPGDIDVELRRTTRNSFRDRVLKLNGGPLPAGFEHHFAPASVFQSESFNESLLELHRAVVKALNAIVRQWQSNAEADFAQGCHWRHRMRSS